MINTIDAAKCTGCGTCYKTCGLDVFRIDTNQDTLSPCMATCPAGTDIRAWNALMQQGNIAEAAQKLKNIPGIAFSYLTKVDVVRHPLVEKIIAAYEKE